MADLAEALDDALRDRYPITGPKTPATQRRGLTARMNGLERLFTRKGDRKGAAARRAAEAAGIPARTWRKWRAGTQKPAPASVRKLEGAFNRLITLPNFRRSLKSKKAPNRVKVTAIIKWSSSPGKNYNRKAGGARTTTLESMRPVMVEVIRAWGSAGPEAAAEKFETRTAEAYRADEIRFEGDHVIIEFLEGEH